MTYFDAPIAAATLSRFKQSSLFQNCRIDLPQGQKVGGDDFRLVKFQGREAASDLFEYQLELRAEDNADATLPFDGRNGILGRPITVGIGSAMYESRAAGQAAFLQALASTDDPGAFAMYNGIVAAFSFELPGVYRITMRPAAHRMSLTNHYRVFTRKRVWEVIEQVCREHGVKASFSGLKGPENLASQRVQDWFQAGESDLDFVRRLLGKAHIYFYFRHTADEHVMVFDNRAIYPSALPEGVELRYTYTSVDELGHRQSDVVTQYSYQQSMGISGVEGVFAMQNEAWDVQQPGEPLATFTRFQANGSQDPGDLPFRQHKVVQYGFSINQVREYAQSTDAAMRSADCAFNGASTCPLLRVGHRFKVTGSVRPELDGQEFVLTEVQHDSSLDGEYHNQFGARPAAGLIAAVGLQDTQQGVVLAHVTTPDGSDAVEHWPYYIPDDFSLGYEVMSDSAGVQKQLKAKGVHVRLATDPPDAKPVWVKLAAHMQTIPEVGTCVWVSRGNDESELPEVQNMVQADGSSTITDTRWTAHSSVGNSYSTSYGDSRSVRFGQPWSRGDVTTAVKLVEDAYGRGVFRDAGYSRGGNYNYSESESKERGMLAESWSYGSTYNYSWSLEQRSFSATGSAHHQSIVGRSSLSQATPSTFTGEAASAVQSSLSEVYGDTYAKSDNYGDTKSIATYTGKVENTSTHMGDVNSTTTMLANSTNVSVALGIGTNIGVHDTEINLSTTNLQASMSLIAATASTTTIGASISDNTVGASISSSMTGVHQGTDIVGVSSSESMTGVADRNNLIGVSVDMTLQGSGNAISIIGEETRMSVTGSNTTMSVVGDTTSISVVGASTSVEVAGGGVSVSVKSSQAKVDLDGPVMQIPAIILVL